jgi:hypothetical protein
LSAEITLFDIFVAISAFRVSHYFRPLGKEELDQFIVQREKNGEAISFSALSVKLVLMVLQELSQGRIPVLVPRYAELNLEELAEVLKLSTQEIETLESHGKISLCENRGEKKNSLK